MICSCCILCVLVPGERPVIYRERAAGAYRVSAYYFAKMTSEIPLMMALPFACHNIIYWFAGFVPEAGAYFASLFMLLLGAMVAQVTRSVIK